MERLRACVDRALDAWLPAEPDCPRPLAEAMRYAVFPGGKRLRPILVLLASEACGGSDERAMPAACAVELVHCYSLVHDDLPAMDDDDLRRGRPTCHKVFGEALAILAGDALLTLAFQILAQRFRPSELAGEACTVLASAVGAAGMVGGQVEDLVAAQGHPLAAAVGAAESVRTIHERKTGQLFAWVH
jgi:geranylgeranyl diphosphate synthase type II